MERPLHRRLPEVLACYFPEVCAAIDWSQPPKTQALHFRKQLVDFEKENKMPYLIDTEEIAIEQALSQGLSQGRVLTLQEDVIEVLNVRFERVPEGLKEAISGIAEEARLRGLLKSALRAETLEAFARLL